MNTIANAAMEASNKKAATTAINKKPSVPGRKTEHKKVVVIGSGFSGLGMAIKLQQSNETNFVVIEKGNDVGGTWRDNSYPGCACDVQSHLYSYSFAPNPSWSRMFAAQPEIFNYLKDCANRFAVRKYIRFNTGLKKAEWNEKKSHWQLKFDNGSALTCDFLVTGMGALHRPAIPTLKGIEKFAGPHFHSANWQHDVSLKGKKIAVVGTGASAIQFLPEIAPAAGTVTLFQRTAPWVLPKPDRHVSAVEKLLFKRLPLSQRFMRNAIYWQLESRALGFNISPRLMTYVKYEGQKHIRAQIDDPDLRRQVTPDYMPGCKRVLISNNYYPALARNNVVVESSSIKEVVAEGIITNDGKLHRADVIVYGTGFKVEEPIPRGMVKGINGADIIGEPGDTPSAYKGISVAGFPNLFMLLGPNTGLGHNSIIYMIEAQIDYVLTALEQAKKRGIEAMEVREPVQVGFNEGLQKRLKKSVWSSGCESWYLDKNGKNFTIWPGFTWQYRQQTERFRSSDYSLSFS